VGRLEVVGRRGERVVQIELIVWLQELRTDS